MTEQEKAKQWLEAKAPSSSRLHIFTRSQVGEWLAAYASSQLSSKEAELAELRKQRDSHYAELRRAQAIIDDLRPLRECAVLLTGNDKATGAELAQSLREQVERLTSERDELELTNNLIMDASLRAAADWRRQDPEGRKLTLPDLKEHILWAFTELSAAREFAAFYKSAYDTLLESERACESRVASMETALQSVKLIIRAFLTYKDKEKWIIELRRWLKDNSSMADLLRNSSSPSPSTTQEK